MRSLRFPATYGSMFTVALALNGCARALHNGSPPASERIRVLAAQPEKYWIEIDAPDGSDYEIPPNGKLTVQFPDVPKNCQSLLFGIVPVSPKPGPAALVVRRGWWTTIHRWDFYEVQRLPMDKDGYRILSVETPDVPTGGGEDGLPLPPEALRP